MKSYSLPSDWQCVVSIWMRNFLQFRKTWMVSLFWIVIEPLFVLLALGYGLGSYIPQVEGASYIEFFFPALICNSVMMVSFFECSYASFTKLSYSHVFRTALLAPMLPIHILSGEVLWGATKGLLSAIGVLLVASFFGAVGSFKIIFALPVLFLLGLLFAMFGMLITSLVRNYDQIIYPSSGLIIPLSLFSGTYFPLTSLPAFFQVITFLSPLTHAVSATRSIQQGKISAFLVVNILALILFLYICQRLTAKHFEKRLMQ